MGARTKDQIRNDIASLQGIIASQKAQVANTTDKNAKARIRDMIAYNQGRLAKLKAELKNAK